MVDIPKRSGKVLATGELLKVSEFRKFATGDRGRIGVQVKVKNKGVWFNLYGTENDIQQALSPIDLGDAVKVEYNEREYSVGNTTRKSRDIVTIDLVKGKKLSDKDIDAFMPTSKINTQQLIKDLNKVGVIINHWRGALSGEEKKEGS